MRTRQTAQHWEFSLLQINNGTYSSTVTVRQNVPCLPLHADNSAGVAFIFIFTVGVLVLPPQQVHQRRQIYELGVQGLR